MRVARVLVGRVALLVLLLAMVAGSAWARCNSLSITVEGIAEPYVDGALVRVEVEPGTPRESVAVWPEPDGKFSASFWYSTQVGLGIVGNDCSRRPKTVLVTMTAGDRKLATARLDVTELAVDALGNYRTKGRVTLKSDGRPASQ